jgi:hypothetical protein
MEESWIFPQKMGITFNPIGFQQANSLSDRMILPHIKHGPKLGNIPMLLDKLQYITMTYNTLW